MHYVLYENNKYYESLTNTMLTCDKCISNLEANAK